MSGGKARGTMVEMDADAFERLVVEELDRLPDDMVDGLDNVIFVVEDQLLIFINLRCFGLHPIDVELGNLDIYQIWCFRLKLL